MIYLISAILFGSLFAVLFKIFAQKGVNTMQAIIFNYVTAILIGPLSDIVQGQMPFSSFNSIPLLPAVLTGLFMVGGFLFMSNTTKSHGVAIATIATRVSFIIPTICAYLFLGESNIELQTSLMVIIALILIFYTKGKHGINIKKWYNPVLVFLCYGCANFLLKYCQSNVNGNSALLALTTITFTSALILSILLAYTQKGNSSSFQWSNLLAGVILGICNISCTYFLLKALTYYSTAIFYPTYNVSIVILGILAGRLLFKERLNTLQIIGVLIAILAILFV